MTPLPMLLAAGAPVVGAWRIDAARHAPTWDSGIVAELKGGRWNPKGVKAVYCALDPATTILELAVHMGFMALDTMPFILTCLQVTDVIDVHVVRPADVPNAVWLHNGAPSGGQQIWGAALLDKHDFVLFPSVVSKSSWNIVFRPNRAIGKYQLVSQDPFSLDTRLNPPAS